MVSLTAHDTELLDKPGADGGWGKWWVCALLLLASTINYMDRQTLSSTAVRIKTEMGIDSAQYGKLETYFGYGFAAGSLIFGVLADRVSVRILYPIVVLLWSGVGFLTGFARDYDEMFYCRLLLGVFEGGHWPCALKTTQLMLSPRDRMLGNSVLQSGTSIGAIVTPLLMLALLTDEAGSWRPVFQGIGAVGIGWMVLWLLSMPWLPDSQTAAIDKPDSSAVAEEPWWHMFVTRRFWILSVLVISINLTWHLLRAWMQQFLQQGRDYPEADALIFISVYFIATDVGCLGGGAISRWLHDRGATVFHSRMAVYSVAAVLCLLTFALPWLPSGWPLMAALLVIGMASLALFPCYYSLAQDISARHQGLATGSLGTINWIVTSPFHELVGNYVKETQNYDAALAWAGLPPILALGVIWIFWDQDPPGKKEEKVD